MIILMLTLNRTGAFCRHSTWNENCKSLCSEAATMLAYSGKGGRAMSGKVMGRMCVVLGIWLSFVVGGEAQHGARAQNEVDLADQIELYRAASLHADPPAMTALQAGRIWTRLGMLYEEAGKYGQSEMAFVHALRLLGMPPVEERDRARAMDEMGTLYMVLGDSRQAERAGLQALAIREAQGFKEDLPRSWYHLAALALREHRAGKAREYAEQAVTQLRAEAGASDDDRMSALFVLAMALCRLHRYPEAIATLQEAMAVVRSAYESDDFPTGFGSFLLGYAYWKSGDSAKAAEPMHAGAWQVQKDLGWEHPACLSVMTQYERFLRSTHHKEEARNLRGELKRARGISGVGHEAHTVSILSLF
jgi:tetratricopeptide (TPR) repeat protein